MKLDLTEDEDKVFAEFLNSCKDRLEEGAKSYGNASFSLNPQMLIGEIEEEIMDVCNWSFILFMRLQKMREAIFNSGLGEEGMEDWPGETDISKYEVESR
jgi:hypothetical protein